jgi:hypothetical protein
MLMRVGAFRKGFRVIALAFNLICLYDYPHLLLYNVCKQSFRAESRNTTSNSCFDSAQHDIQTIQKIPS